ncbi:MAG: transglutaminase family protein [Burkholderiales bacterium]|nr:transglutaminase family protein [Burkholderiales bacterium]
MKLTVTHETRYVYASRVEQAHHIAHLQPVSNDVQTLHSHHLSISPTPSERSSGADAYGQPREYFELATPHSELVVTADSLVTTAPLPAALIGSDADATLAQGTPWEALVERMQYRAGQPFDAAREFVHSSPLAPVHVEFARYAATLATPGRSVHALARALCARIHADFRYAPQSTDVSTPPLDALSRREGVCQDFAQVMIACLRSLGLPARYVSGYLLTSPPPDQPRLVGADASHAWVSVYCPSKGWLEFDPTNDCLAGEGHVRLGYGRDYGDVPPLRGVIRGGGSHQLSVAVTVSSLADETPGSRPVTGQSQSQTQSPSRA